MPMDVKQERKPFHDYDIVLNLKDGFGQFSYLKEGIRVEDVYNASLQLLCALARTGQEEGYREAEIQKMFKDLARAAGDIGVRCISPEEIRICTNQHIHMTRER